jgi:hypothetical protein
MGIFMRHSTFIDSLEYFHKCVKKEKNRKNSLSLFLGEEGHKWTKKSIAKRRETIKIILVSRDNCSILDTHMVLGPSFVCL